jgi:curli biogenesis system outer membrane secretion channel CsgG
MVLSKSNSTEELKLMNKSIFVALGLVAGIVVAGSASAAGGPAIGVAEFTNQTSAGWWRGDLGWALSGMLSNELSSSGFRVVERSKLEKVLGEQDLAASGRVSKGTGAKIGKLTGADYLVFGTVTAYQENTSSTGGGINIRGIGIGGKQSEAYLAVDIRVVNTTTGEVDYSRTIEGRSTSSGVAVGISRGGVGAGFGHMENTPAGKAVRAALVESGDYLDCVMIKRDSCVAQFNAKEQKRRDSDKKALKLD